MTCLSKRGNVAVELLYIVVALFVLAVAAGILLNFNSDMKPVVDEMVDEENREDYDNQVENYPGWFDNVFVFILGMLWISSMISAFFIDTHPVFLIVSIVLVAFVFVFAGFVSNTYEELSTDLESDVAFPMTAFVFDNLIMFIIGIVGSVLTCLYIKGAA